MLDVLHRHCIQSPILLQNKILVASVRTSLRSIRFVRPSDLTQKPSQTSI